jgi:acyl-CoA synthetase (AMP-forming)/AMP-acid ligase II
MIIDALARYAAEDPRSLAFASGPIQMTYADLWRGVGSMETRIKQAAIPRAARVGVAIADLRLAWLAILALEKMGHAAFAVPPGPAPTALGLANTGAILIAGGAAPSDGTTAVDVAGAVSLPPAAGLGSAALRPEQEQFTLLSAATSGRNKRIQLTNAMRDARIRQTIAQQGYGPATRLFLGAWGPWTDTGYVSAVAAWSAGGMVIAHQQPGAAAAVSAVKAAAASATQGMVEIWLRELGPHRAPANGLRLSLKGPLAPATLVAVQEGFQGAEIYVEIGAPECGVAARGRVNSGDDLRSLPLAPGVECQIVTPDGQRVPDGQMGAIRWRTDSLVRGYVDDPAATAVFFRDGWFYPGTMGVLEGGRLSVTGRYSEVIEVRGDTLAPADIEAPLHIALNAREVAAIAKPVAGTLDELHVFVVEGGPVTPELASSALKPFQGAFSKIRLHKSERLPRNAAGKILYGSLRPLART